MVMIFVAGHENPQCLLVSLMYLLAKDQVCEDQLEAQTQKLITGVIRQHRRSSVKSSSARLERKVNLRNMPCKTSPI